mmetsp:Transcript_15063/g.43211  ORF Transcript_15063/g.43211 Transcript_15063/m.43211 type:complete len:588 (-) Transcript_15063:1015-2778(-)
MEGSRASSSSEAIAPRWSSCERPKSASLTRPSHVRSMFSGLRSRWMMPHVCRCSRPRHVSAIREMTCRSSSTPRRCSRCFASEARHSITRCSRSASSKAKKTVTTNGDWHEKSTFRSVTSRWSRPRFLSITFIANSSRVCRLRTSHTAACEPRWISRTISKSASVGGWPEASGSAPGCGTMVHCSSLAHCVPCCSAASLRAPAALMSAHTAAVEGETRDAATSSSIFGGSAERRGSACEPAVSEVSTSVYPRNASSSMQPCVAPQPKMCAVFATALRRTTMRASVSSQDEASVLHCITMLQKCVCCPSEARMTRCSHNRQTPLAGSCGVPSAAWTATAVVCAAAEKPPYSSCSCSACSACLVARSVASKSRASFAAAAASCEEPAWAAAWAAVPATGCCTPIQKRTPPPAALSWRRARIGVMKSRLPKRDPSLRKFETSVSDSCCASSARDMCCCAARCEARSASAAAESNSAGGGGSAGGSRNSDDCRKRQLTWSTSWGEQPHMTPKPDDAKTIGLRKLGSATVAEGSVTRRLRRERRRNVYRSHSCSAACWSTCRCSIGSDEWTSRMATATDPTRGPAWWWRGRT